MSKYPLNEEIEYYTQLIKEECNKISSTFSLLSRLYQETTHYLKNKRNKDLFEENENKSKHKIKKLHKFIKKKIKKVNSFEIQHKREIVGKIQEVNAYDNKNKITIKGYLVIIFYKCYQFDIGPFSDYNISLLIKDTLYSQLNQSKQFSSLKENKVNCLISCLNSVKKTIYEKYPPLKILDQNNLKNNSDKIKVKTKYNNLKIQNQKSFNYLKNRK